MVASVVVSVVVTKLVRVDVVLVDWVETLVLCADTVVNVPTMKNSVDLPVQVTVLVMNDVEVPVVVMLVVVLVEDVVVVE